MESNFRWEKPPQANTGLYTKEVLCFHNQIRKKGKQISWDFISC